MFNPNENFICPAPVMDELAFLHGDCEDYAPCPHCPDYPCPVAVMADCPDAPRPYV